MTQEEMEWMADTIYQRYRTVRSATIPTSTRVAMLKGMELLIGDLHRQCILDLSISGRDWRLACTTGRALAGAQEDALC